MAIKKKVFINLGVSLWIMAIIFALFPIWPNIYYRIFPQTSESLASTIAYTVTKEANAITVSPTPTPSISPKITPSPTPQMPLPDFDPSLPEENGLIIDKIGVRGEIHEGDNWQETLKKGIWRVPNFSSPDLPQSNQPVIIAAHRWGYLDWSASFRKLNSFYNLPKLSTGDKIEIVWNQRKFEYTVYSTTVDTSITDYKANLILYTCQLWNSPTRFFVYANRIK